MIAERIGNYRILRKIGEGGMGTVYEAVLEQIGRRAAIKLLRPEVSHNPELSGRLLSEARAVNIIGNPGVVNIYELGKTEDGSAYIVMEYLDGEPLYQRTLRRGGKLPIDEALRLARQIASTLELTHNKGIIHRDLKPDNVMVVADPEAPCGERTKLLDFGIAKLSAEYQAAQGHLRTRTGTMMGTPAYMAPEQCEGVKTIDDKADVYSLGVMLFEMLAGRLPFEADALGKMMMLHMSQAPPELSSLAPEVPTPFAQLVHAMLSKDPTQRPNMAEVSAKLEAIGAPRVSRNALATISEAASAFGLSTGVAPGAKKRRPHQALLWLGGGLTIGATVGALLVGLRSPPQKSQPVVAALQTCPSCKDSAVKALRHWSVASEPTGAAVLRASDETFVGTTPWRAELPAPSDSLTLILRRPGYQDKTVVLSREHDEERAEHLLPQVAAIPRKTPKLGAKSQKLVKADEDVAIVK